MKEDFYIRLKDYKKKKRVSNAVLGAVLGKNEPAMRQAIKRESLSKFEINELEKLFEPIIEKKESDLSMEVKELKEQVKGLQDNFKMIWDQLLFLQNSWMQDRKERSEKKDLG